MPNVNIPYLGFSGKNGEPSAPPMVPGGTDQYGHPTTAYSTARYTADDAWKPASQSADEVALLQQRLVNAGYTPQGGFRKGIWDTDSAKAYARALGTANQNGMSVNDLLSQQSSPEAGGGPGGGGRGGGGGGSVGPEKRAVERPNVVTGGHTIELTAPQDIEKAAGDTFTKLLGRNIRGDETLTLVQQLQNMDRLNQATKYGQEDTVKGANFMQDMATANQRQAEAGASVDQRMALAEQAKGAESGTILPGADTSGMQIGGFQTKLPNAETTAAPNPAAYAEWVIKTKMPNEYLGAQMADRARQMGDFLTKPTAPQGGPLTRTRV